jgi:hypothetical protein
MLPVIKSFCTRTLGWPRVRSVDADRRVLIRTVATPQGGTHSEADSQGSPLTASLLRASKTALDLLIDQPFDPGTRLDLEFPGPGGPAPHLLACVVRSTRQPQAKWTAECWLPLPLRRSELSWLGSKQGVPLKEDRRQWLRWSCRGDAFFRRASGAETEFFPATVSDISFGGVRLLAAAHAPEVGARLELVLERVPPAPAIRMLAIVCHTQVQPDGSTAFGCGFIRELGWNELWSVLSPTQVATDQR